MLRGLAARSVCRYRDADPRSPRSNDAALRLTNDFNSIFLFLLLRIIVREELALRIVEMAIASQHEWNISV
jgi:hypothetical protein